MDLPKVEITDRAVTALKSFHRDDEPDTLRIELMEDGSHGLAFTAKQDGDVELSGKAGGSYGVTEALSVYGEVSFITAEDDNNYGAKLGAKYNF